MMLKAAVFEAATGIIRKVITCPLTELNQNVGVDENAVIVTDDEPVNDETDRVDVVTGQILRNVVTVTPPTRDELAARAADSVNRIIFEVLFNHEERLRVIESKPAITKVQFRDALINLWKQLNP